MKEGTRLDALAVAYCLAAAASGTVAGSLTVLGAGCLSLLLIGTVLKLWGRRPSPLRSACALLPAAALAAIPEAAALTAEATVPETPVEICNRTKNKGAACYEYKNQRDFTGDRVRYRRQE